MELLIFAHRLEASYFIESESWTPVKNLPVKGLPFTLLKNSPIENSPTENFPNKSLKTQKLLLITGEGIEEALMATSVVLTQWCEHIKRVINFGVAGHLSSATQKLELETIYPIRTIYAQASSEILQHKSFLLDPPHFVHANFVHEHTKPIDCLSCVERILDDKKANDLSHFAPAVDRELWGIAKACAQFKVPLNSYKLISDQAGKQTQCLDIRQRAQEYSRRLYDRYSDEYSDGCSDRSSDGCSSEYTDISSSGYTDKCSSGYTGGYTGNRHEEKISEKIRVDLPNAFHITHSQRQRLDKLISIISLRDKNKLDKNGQSTNGQSMNGQSMNGQSMNGQSMNGQSMNDQSMNRQSMNDQSMNKHSMNKFLEEQIKKISQTSLTPKQRTQKLIKTVEEHLNPFTQSLVKKIDEYTQVIQKNKDLKIQFAESYESENFDLTLHVKNSEQLQDLIKDIQTLDVNGLQSFLTGEENAAEKKSVEKNAGEELV